MHVLFTTPPLYGHFHPLVPYAQALQAAGHEVAFAVPGDFCAVVEQAGFKCFHAGQSWSRVDADRQIRAEHPDLAEPFPFPIIFPKLFIDVPAPAMVRDLDALFETWRPEVVVRDACEFGSCIAAERAGIPHARAGAGEFRPPEWWMQVAAEPLNVVRRQCGLSEDRGLEMLHRFLDLVSMPPVLLRDEDYVDPVAQFIQPSGFDQAADAKLPSWIGELPDRPTLYGTLGTTIWNQVPGAFEVLAGGLANEPYNVILTVGWDRDPASIEPRASNLHVEQYIPQSLLLPYCDAVICHGGFSSMLAALMQGLPLVIMPLGADQFENAARAEQIGAAKVVGPEERIAERLREAVRTVLGDPSYREHAERFQADARALPGLDYAVELLEQLARERKPILSRTP